MITSRGVVIAPVNAPTKKVIVFRTFHSNTRVMGSKLVFFKDVIIPAKAPIIAFSGSFKSRRACKKRGKYW